MENEQQVLEELNDWEQIQLPFSTSNESPVFPPTNHEDLPITSSPPQQDDEQHLQESGPLNSIPPSNGGDGPNKWMIIRLRLRVFLSGIFRVFCGVRKFGSCRDGFWPFAWPACGVAASVMVLIWWQRRMIRLIGEKDQKINQLLLQIAQMNEVLLARRRVRVLRVK